MNAWKRSALVAALGLLATSSALAAGSQAAYGGTNGASSAPSTSSNAQSDAVDPQSSCAGKVGSERTDCLHNLSLAAKCARLSGAERDDCTQRARLRAGTSGANDLSLAPGMGGNAGGINPPPTKPSTAPMRQ